MNPFSFFTFILLIGAVFGAFVGIIYANTIDYWHDVKKYGKVTADAIRKRY